MFTGGHTGTIKTLQVSLLSFFLSFPPFQALTLRPLCCESKKHMFMAGAVRALAVRKQENHRLHTDLLAFRWNNMH